MKNFFAFILLIVFWTVLPINLLFFNFLHTFTQAEFYKKLFAATQVYEYPFLFLQEAVRAGNSDVTDIPVLTPEDVEDMLRIAIKPSSLQAQAEPLLDEFFSLLIPGKTLNSVNLVIFLGEWKQNLTKVLNEKIEEKLAYLPECEETTENTPPATAEEGVDGSKAIAMELTCIPAGISRAELKQQITENIEQDMLSALPDTFSLKQVIVAFLSGNTASFGSTLGETAEDVSATEAEGETTENTEAPGEVAQPDPEQQKEDLSRAQSHLYTLQTQLKLLTYLAQFGFVFLGIVLLGIVLLTKKTKHRGVLWAGHALFFPTLSLLIAYYSFTASTETLTLFINRNTEIPPALQTLLKPLLEAFAQNAFQTIQTPIILLFIFAIILYGVAMIFAFRSPDSGKGSNTANVKNIGRKKESKFI